MNNEELYTLFVTSCCDFLVEVKIDERFLLEQKYELVCPNCGKKEYQS